MLESTWQPMKGNNLEPSLVNSNMVSLTQNLNLKSENQTRKEYCIEQARHNANLTLGDEESKTIAQKLV